MKIYKTISIFIVISMIIFNFGQVFALSSTNLTDVSSETASPSISVTAATNPESDFNFIPNPNNTEITITGYHGSTTDVVIPEFINELPVTTIGNNAFENNNTIVSVTMPIVTTIGNFAFSHCTNLKTVDGPKVTSIGNSSFHSCESLSTLNLPEVTTIEDYGFYMCYALTSVSFPKLTTLTGNASFASCINLTSVDFPLLTSVNNSSFSACEKLVNVNLPSVTNLGKAAFNFCTSLTTLNLPLIETIGDAAFQNCTSLSDINISNATTLGYSVFENCSSLQNIQLPNITIISPNLFLGCINLKTIDLTAITSIGAFAFNGCTSLTAIDMPKVTSIGDSAFSGCSELNDVIISNQATSIETDAFTNTGISSITIDYGTADISKVTMSDWYNFATTMNGLNANEVTGRYVKNNTGIKAFTKNFTYFETATDVTILKYTGIAANVVIPDYINGKPVTTIGESAFAYNNNIVSVTMPEVTTINSKAFSLSNSLTTIIGPKVTKIGNSAFESSINLRNLTLPEVTTIDTRAFATCTNLTTVSFPKLTTLTGIATFNTCDNLTSVNLPLITTVPNATFSNCTKLTDVNLPLATTISDYSFYACIALKNITLEKAKTIGFQAFVHCTNLQSVNLPSVTTIGNSAFSGCSELNNVIISNQGTSIGTDAFKNTGITSVTIDYGTADISAITITDWNNFVTSMGLTPDSIPGKYVMNESGIRNLSDIIPPVITLNDPNPMTIIVGSTFTDPGYTVTDNSGELVNVTVSGTVDSNKVGVYTLTYTATDIAGNISEPVIRTVKVIYNYSGILQPINTDGTSIFKAGSTVPVKFQLKDAKGNLISYANASLYYEKYSNSTLGPINEALSTSAATTGNAFRYSEDKYIFNLSTKGLTAGKYRLTVKLDDGESYSICIGLR